MDEGRGPPERAARELQLLLVHQTLAARLGDHLAQLGVCEVVPADEAEREGSGGGLQYPVTGVEDDGCGAQHGQDAADTGGEVGFRLPRGCAPGCARAERQHGDGADDEAGETRHHRRPRHAHPASVSGRGAPSGAV